MTNEELIESLNSSIQDLTDIINELVRGRKPTEVSRKVGDAGYFLTGLEADIDNGM